MRRGSAGHGGFPKPRKIRRRHGCPDPGMEVALRDIPALRRCAGPDGGASPIGRGASSPSDRADGRMGSDQWGLALWPWVGIAMSICGLPPVGVGDSHDDTPAEAQARDHAALAA